MNKKKEILWLLQSSLLTVIFYTLIFGIEGLKVESSFDLNLYDTYYVIPSLNILPIIGVLVFFGFYLLTTLRRSFKNLTANVILMISTFLLLIILFGLTSILDDYSNTKTGWAIHPPLDTDEIFSQPETKGHNLKMISSILFYTKLGLFVFLVFCGSKTIQNFNRRK